MSCQSKVYSVRAVACANVFAIGSLIVAATCAALFVMHSRRQEATLDRTIAESQVVLVDVLNSMIRYRGARLATSHTVVLGEAWQGDAVDLSLLRHLPYLQVFLSAGAEMDDEEIGVLASMPRLQIVDLSATRINPRSLLLFKDSQSLEQLKVDRSEATERIVKDLQAHPCKFEILFVEPGFPSPERTDGDTDIGS